MKVILNNIMEGTFCQHFFEEIYRKFSEVFRKIFKIRISEKLIYGKGRQGFLFF